MSRQSRERRKRNRERLQSAPMKCNPVRTPEKAEVAPVKSHHVWDAEQVENARAIANHFAIQMKCKQARSLERRPEPGCDVADCHKNVAIKVHRQGGRAVWGWQFVSNRADGGQKIDAAFHCVWESPDGELIDITPVSDRVQAGRDAGVFLPFPWFVEDPSHYFEYTVEEVGVSFQGKAVRVNLPVPQCLSRSI